MQNTNPDNSISFDLQNDVILSMEQKINDLSLSLSQISTKNYSLMKQLSQSELSHKQAKRCPSEHPLRYLLVDSTKSSQYMTCDQCNKKIDNLSNVSWRCDRCDFDLCAHCGGYEKSVCPYFHTLEFIDKFSNKSYQCDVCLSNHLKSGWHCQCNFDMCEKCFDKQ